MEWVPLTDAAVAVKRLEIEKEIDAAYLDYVRGIVTNDMSRMIKAARAIESKTGTRVMKWLEATPIVSNAIGLFEGLMTDRIFAVASDDPNGTLEPFRHKPGPTNEHPDAPPREEGAFGVQKHGLSEFSRLLEKFKWRIVDTKDPAKIFAHKDQPSPRGADSPRVPPR
jgi:hypothetical protein